MVERPSLLGYYFVPLGREPGGYLEILGLPPTATEKQAKSRYSQYLRRLDEEGREKRRLPKAQLEYGKLEVRLDKGEIIQEKFKEDLEEIVTSLLPSEITAKLRYKKLKAECEAGQLTKSKRGKRLDKILGPIGSSDLLYKYRDGEITRKEYEDERATLIARLEESALTAEEIQAQRDAVLIQLQGSQITQEEFAALERQWQEEKAEKKTHLNSLKKPYDARIAQKRECETKGFVYDDTVWLDMWYQEAGTDELDASSGSLHPTAAAAERGPGPVAALEEVVGTADELWSGLRGTNRAYWQEKVRTWGGEIQQMGPSFDLERAEARAGAHGQPVEPEFPSLAEPFPLAIGRLEKEEVEEVAVRPQRVGERRELDLDLLLAAALGDLARRAPIEKAPPTAAPRPSQRPARPAMDRTEQQRRAEEFREFLEALAEIAKKKK